MNGAAALLLVGQLSAQAALTEGATIKITREAQLNGVTLAKGTELEIVALRRDDTGQVNKVVLQQVEDVGKVWKAITVEAVAALTAPPNTAAPADDRSSVFKVAAQIPIVSDLVLGDVVFKRGTVLQIDRVEKDKSGRTVKLDLRETSGKKRLMRGVVVEKLLVALAPDDVTWPDGAVGRVITLPRELKYEGTTYGKGTRWVVTRVETEPKGGQVVKVDLRESQGEKRELARVSVALLKQNGALGGAEGAVP